MLSRVLAFARRSTKGLLLRRGWRIKEVSDFDYFESLLHYIHRSKGSLTFVQIGANDGFHNDPLHDFVTRAGAGVRGFALEPVGDYYRDLVRTYASYPGITPINAAIHNTETSMTIHRVDPSKRASVPEWAKGIASFRPDHHELSGTAAGVMISETVTCMTIKDLLTKHQVGDFDVLVTDTEGYDAEILLALDFSLCHPRVIRFEHGLQDGVMSRKRFLDVIGKLKQAGYEIAIESYDATAYLPELFLGRN